MNKWDFELKAIYKPYKYETRTCDNEEIHHDDMKEMAYDENEGSLPNSPDKYGNDGGCGLESKQLHNCTAHDCY